MAQSNYNQKGYAQLTSAITFIATYVIYTSVASRFEQAREGGTPVLFCLSSPVCVARDATSERADWGEE